jgi:signal transduction histidine kinase
MKRVRDVLETEIGGQVRDLETLAREVTQRKRDLSTALDSMRVAREQAERASQLKTDFLGMVSHELRTPLTALSMQFHRLLRGTGNELDAGQRTLVGRMQRSAGRLTELVESLLEYASLQSGRLVTHPEDLDLGEMATAAVDDARSPAEEKGLKLRIEVRTPLPPLRSDPRLVRLVLANLVQNAIKFTDRGTVDVSISAENAHHRLSIRDTGPGIPREEQERIFQPFVQLEPAARKHTPGVGLGLAIVRDLVTALGGRLALQSEPGLGSTFTVDLPSLARS